MIKNLNSQMESILEFKNRNSMQPLIITNIKDPVMEAIKNELLLQSISGVNNVVIEISKAEQENVQRIVDAICGDDLREKDYLEVGIWDSYLLGAIVRRLEKVPDVSKNVLNQYKNAAMQYELLTSLDSWNEYKEYANEYEIFHWGADFYDLSFLSMDLEGITVIHFINAQDIDNERVKSRIDKLISWGGNPCAQIYTTDSIYQSGVVDDISTYDGSKLTIEKVMQRQE